MRAEHEDFAGTNSQEAEIGRIIQEFAAGIPEEEIINYHPEDADDPDH